MFWEGDRRQGTSLSAPCPCRRSISRTISTRPPVCGGSRPWVQERGWTGRTGSSAAPACAPQTWCQVGAGAGRAPLALRDGWGGFSQWDKTLPPHGDTALTVSEAPKEAPARKFVPASVYLEEKTDEQKKEEVGSGMTTLWQGRG